MTPNKPLLTICVPTYNRADFLKVMLQALLPQAAKHAESVEVLILDNASPDGTPDVIEQSRELGPFRNHRNSENIGAVANIVRGARDHAAGEFVWILGDHNLMAPGALDSVVETLSRHREIDLFYVNYRCAIYPDQWPGSGAGGYDGPFDCIGNQKIDNRQVTEWHELIRPESAMCTQIYAHIVRTQIWKDYWIGHDSIASHQDGKTTYPHTYMIADTSFNKPACYIGKPAVTIFNGAQSWDAMGTKTTVFLKGLPELIDLFEKGGLLPAKLLEARRFSSKIAYEHLVPGFGYDDSKHALPY